MEFGSSSDEMVFDSFEHLAKTVDKLYATIENRKMMTGSEALKLKRIKEKVRLYLETDQELRRSVKSKIDFLLKTYYTFYG